MDVEQVLVDGAAAVVQRTADLVCVVVQACTKEKKRESTQAQA
jgi:hypothetical protein